MTGYGASTVPGSPGGGGGAAPADQGPANDRPAWWRDRTGVYNGKSWHIKNGHVNKRPNGRLVFATFCGQDADPMWSPGINNFHPPLCGKCRKGFEGRAARQAEANA